MLTISNLRLPVGAGEAELKEKAAKALGVRPEDIVELTLTRQSIDARKKQDVHLVCQVFGILRRIYVHSLCQDLHASGISPCEYCC